MVQFSHVFDLVASLSKSEKRYFRLNSIGRQGDKAFMTLFNLIEKGIDSPAAVKSRFKKTYPTAVFEVACKHLYKMVMRSLRNFEEGKSIENKLLNLIQDIRILFNKGILGQCFSEIERGKKIALQYEKHLLHLQLSRMELQFLQALEFPSLNESQLIQRQDKINDLLYQELFINKHSSLFEILSHRYLHRGASKNERDREKLNDLLLEEFQINANSLYNSFESDKLHRHFQSTYFMMTGEPEQGLQELYELLKLLEDNESHRDDDPVYYIYLLQGIISSLRGMGRFAEMRLFISKLEKLVVSAHSQRVIVSHFIFQDELGILLSEGNYAAGLKYIESNAKEIHKSNPAPPNVVAVTYLQIALVFFGAGDEHAALRNINAAMFPGELYISQQIFSLCRVISIIIHLELKNDELLTSSVRSMERVFRTKGESYRVERSIVAFTRKWIRSTPSKRTELLANFVAELNRLSQDQYESQFFKWFNIEAWAKSKLLKASR